MTLEKKKKLEEPAAEVSDRSCQLLFRISLRGCICFVDLRPTLRLELVESGGCITFE